ncbi:MerR family transcriptional regulator [Paenibacillus sp. MWE-103]|uniref:MerR family transcriptional regulator n=1 Tax=Paenibacillus artemisiicola TaxID=1172618 RepID=A0ABS3W7U9_9BACL|nr:MerR family transcriptional regulator [Paenibacillus artemisiicola]MBO7744391.1 MerR family transcriptional regulator [Paenibacillus artemisiicola]
METFTISDIVQRTGFSQDTIRYYERIGLLPEIRRKDNGRRAYSQSDLDCFTFVAFLKRANMPLKEIERYIMFYHAQNYKGCMTVLQDHRIMIEDQIADMLTALEMMKFKIANYKELMGRDPSQTGPLTKGGHSLERD